MSDHRATDRAVRLVVLPLLGVLGAVAVVRDQAARTRLRDDDPDPRLPLHWDALTPRQRAHYLPDPEHPTL